ncbi:hypothetical protein [Ammoniphilus sp. YIM 78166]|uniref:hypothetical protein n=1 Tax=Ammoniphilus sp. YIM 78166 TaxID=1644106 RepID=UPI00106FBE81|nr:hypothetical protein [Ammoniphilus sp. YIM 78166]
MIPSVDEVKEWLETHKGSTLTIHKGELSIGKNEVADMDKVDIRLDKVTLNTHEQADPDGYLAQQEFILHGQGKIQSANGEEELPQNVYEIPLYGKVSTRKEENGFTIETERAFYSIHLH